MRRAIVAGLVAGVVSLGAGEMCAQVVVTPSGYATLGGPALQWAPPSAPLLSTPIVTFNPASEQSVGATNATANNQAGARNSTVSNVPGPGSGSVAVPEFLNEDAPGETSMEADRVPHPGFNLGPARSSSIYGHITGTRQGSLGDVARTLRQQGAARNVRVYTNEDVERVGRISNTGEKKSPPFGKPSLPQEDVPQGEPPREQTPPQQPEMSSDISEATGPGLVTVALRTDISEQADSVQAASAANEKQLPPATASSQLPVLALLGLVAGVAGMLCRK